MNGKCQIFQSNLKVCEEIFRKIGHEVILATPLGLGKPNYFLNEIYRYTKNNLNLNLTIYTALSLNIPTSKSSFGQKFFKPFYERYFGKNYPELDYEKDALQNKLPQNVCLRSFYFQPGTAMHVPKLQQEYQSINYTHVAKTLFDRNVNVVTQIIAKNKEKQTYSLSCNPDVSLDLIDLYRKHKKPILVIGVINPELPFLGGEAEVTEDFFDVILDESENTQQLFALPRLPRDPIDQIIGLYASQLVLDNGTLQLGIGSLSDSLTWALILRQKNNKIYSHLLETLWHKKEMPNILFEQTPFEVGLYGLTEMVSDSFMHLRRMDILKRCVKDEKNGIETYLHGAFFLGSKEFYSWLHSLKNETPCGLQMSRISMINHLYNGDQNILRAQRINARFFNVCMQVSLLGGAVSDTLNDGQVVSGVGGQYNFVAMAHELENARSILLLRSKREYKGKYISNIQWNLGNLTIPRHLRDIVITEYGIADLRGKTDQEVIIALLNITDSSFQDELLFIAKKNKKISQDYTIPLWARNNTSQKIDDFVLKDKQHNFFRPYPFQSDFTHTEENIFTALKQIKALFESSHIKDKLKLIFLCLHAFFINPKTFMPELKRMNLEKPKIFTEKLEYLLLLGVLNMLYSKKYSKSLMSYRLSAIKEGHNSFFLLELSLYRNIECCSWC